MKTFLDKFTLSTDKRVEVIDITQRVENSVSKSGFRSGLCLITALHATAAIVINEHEEGLIEDIVAKILETFPEEMHYRHDLVDNNAPAHLASIFLGPSKSFPIHEGRLLRGVWQNIFFVELDGPRSRREVAVEILGE